MNTLGNDGQYEIIYPQTTYEMVIGLLSDETKELMGLTSENTPDDAFKELYLSIVLNGRALINFTVTGDDGTPCKQVQLASANFCDGNGNKLPIVTTNDEGKISVFVDAISVNVSVSQYANFEDWNHTYSVTFGEQYDESVTLNRRNFLKMTSSGSCKFSPEIVRVDVTCVGGGGRGGDGENTSEYGYCGSGGGGGYCTVQEDVSFTPEILYPYAIGAGSNSVNRYGQNYCGGTSNFLEIQATGGQSGYIAGSSEGVAGIGNGNGGASQWGRATASGDYRWYNGNPGGSGTVLGYLSFTEMVYYGGGGGAGAGGNSQNWDAVGGNGGSYGGKGGNSAGTAVNGENGQNGFGGGGGGAGATANQNWDGPKGGRGGSGCVAIRMYTQDTLPT